MSAEWKIPLENVVPLREKENFDPISALEFQREVFESRSRISIYYSFKIIAEYIGATVLLILLSLPMVLISLAILLRMGRPVLYKHQRVGKRGQVFNVLKFRTMKSNAPRVEVLGYKPLEKISNDPRVEGGLGIFLRKHKLDELPQLFNVLMGDMLLIGPRPYPIIENHVMSFKNVSRFAIRPGITGRWQVLEKHVDDPELRVFHDNKYVETLSFVEDLKLVFSTIRVILFGNSK